MEIIGVLNQAQNANIKTAKEEFIERTNLELANILADELVDGVEQTNAERMYILWENMGTDNIKRVTTGGTTYSIDDVKVGGATVVGSDKQVSVVSTDTTATNLEVTIKPISGGSSSYYGIIQGGYYELDLNDSKLVVSDTALTLEDITGESDGDDNEPELKAVFTKNTGTAAITEGTIDQDNKIIPISGSGTAGNVGTGTLTISYGTASTTVTVKVSDPSYGFMNPDYENPKGTGLYGQTVTTGVESVNGIPIADNWKIFYADSDFVYLIYGDYYPGQVTYNKVVGGTTTSVTENVQVENTTTGSTIYAPAHDRSGNVSSYTYSVNSRTDRTTLLKYLKNNSQYSVSSTTQDAVAPNSNASNQYDSWKNLASAFANGNALAQKVTSIQGAPNIEMWVASWNAKQSSDTTRLYTEWSSDNNYGYKIRLKSENSMIYTKQVATTELLYFPYSGTNTKANGYWLASPGGWDASTVCLVRYDGKVHCSYNCNDYGYDLGTRPVVAIPLSDFNSSNVNSLAISNE